MPNRVVAIRSLLALALLGAAACAGDGTSHAGAGGDPELDPCGGADHPCTLADVTEEAKARTEELSNQLLDRLQSPEDLEEAAEWLAGQDGVATVATGPEAVRFRVRGGRGHWVFVQTASNVSLLSAPSMSKPPRAPAPGSAPPASQEDGERQIKKALLLSPFRWQWELEGADDGIDGIAQALRARDYRNRVTVWTERLDPANPNRTIGEIGIPAFTTWDEYDYVHLLTHGGRACNPKGFCMTALMTPWTEDLVSSARAGAEAAGNTELESLIDRVGVETAKVQVQASAAEVPEVGPGQESREDIPLSERDKPEAERQVHTLTGPFILLTAQFFRDTYKRGVDDAVIVISACSSGTDGDLLRAVQGRNTAVIGWRHAMSLGAAAAAGKLIAKTLVEVDEELEDESGLTVGQAMDRIRDRIDELAADPPDYRMCADPSDPEVRARCDLASDAQVLTVINDMPADPVTGASLEVVGDGAVGAGEIVYLADAAGDELSEGDVLAVTGVAGDGRSDSVDLRIRVDGLGLEDDPRSVDLGIVFEGRDIDVEKELEDEVAPGVWELEYRLPLGRDHETGERVTLEVLARLPREKESRWEYRDVVLASCYWVANLTGPVQRRIGGYAVGSGRLELGGGKLMSSVGLRQAPGSRWTESLSFFLSEELGEKPFRVGARQRGGAYLSTPEAPWAVMAGQLELTMFRPDSMIVGGFALSGGGLGLPDFENVELTVKGEFVWSPACPTAGEQLLDLGRRTREFIEQLPEEWGIPEP